MFRPESLKFGQPYHIYNRGNNREMLFREERNYPYFLSLFVKHVDPVVDTYAYCLLPNHFHLLVRVKTVEKQTEAEIGPVSKTGSILKEPSRQFNNLFIAYSKAFNKAFQRTGALFESPFRRKMVEDDRYFTTLVVYIHCNPQNHGLVTDFREWPYSSYEAIVTDEPTIVQRDAVLEWFNGRSWFEESHHIEVDEEFIKAVI